MMIRRSPRVAWDRSRGIVAGSSTGWPSLSRDGLTIFVEVAEVSSHTKIYTATRPAVGLAFGPLAPVVELGEAGANDGDPDLAWDCQSIYFSSDRAGAGKADVYVSTRAN